MLAQMSLFCRPKALCQCSCPADIEKLQGFFLFLRPDKKVCVLPIERIAVGEEWQPELFVLNRRPLIFECLDGFAVPEIGLPCLVLAGIKIRERTLDFPTAGMDFLPTSRRPASMFVRFIAIRLLRGEKRLQKGWLEFLGFVPGLCATLDGFLAVRLCQIELSLPIKQKGQPCVDLRNFFRRVDGHCSLSAIARNTPSLAADYRACE